MVKKRTPSGKAAKAKAGSDTPKNTSTDKVRSTTRIKTPSKRKIESDIANRSITNVKSTPTRSSPRIQKTNQAGSPKRSKRLRITEHEILNASNAELINIINELTTTKQDEYFQQYKTESKTTIQQQADMIEKLQLQYQSQQEIIERLESQQQRERNELFVSPIRKRKADAVNGKGKDDIVNKDEISKEFETIGIIFDMLQLLTGLSIINYEEDLHKYYFEVEQNSTSDKFDPIKITYKIVISKNPNENHEINYIPTFLNNPEVVQLKGVLPEYFWDKLSFPYHTISQFYTKIAKALNRTRQSNSQVSQ